MDGENTIEVKITEDGTSVTLEDQGAGVEITATSESGITGTLTDDGQGNVTITFTLPG